MPSLFVPRCEDGTIAAPLHQLTRDAAEAQLAKTRSRNEEKRGIAESHPHEIVEFVLKSDKLPECYLCSCGPGCADRYICEGCQAEMEARNLHARNGDVVVVRKHNLNSTKEYRSLQELVQKMEAILRKKGLDVQFFLVTEDIDIQSFSEAQMEMMGWVRKD